MKNLLYTVVIIIIIIFFAMPTIGTEIISKSPAIILIDDFNTYSLAELLKATNKLKSGDEIKIITVGPGGNAYVLMAMINVIEDLQKRGVTIITEIQGMACSANAFLWIAGDERIVHRHDLVMFHLAFMADRYGNKKATKDLDPLQRMILKNINDWMHFKLMRTIRNTEIVNNMIDDPENWYSGIDLFRICVATKMIEN